MGCMSDRDRLAEIDAEIEALKAKKELRVLEDALVAKKADGSVTEEDKLALREARQDFRLNHRKPVKNGAQPGAIGLSVSQPQVDG